MVLRSAFAMLAVGILLAPGLPGQYKREPDQTHAPRDVQGIVSDANGKPVASAIVQLKNTKTLQIISFITKDQGNYYFNGLSPDIDFELFAEHEGKVSVTRTLSAFDSRKQAVINLKLDRDKKK